MHRKEWDIEEQKGIHKLRGIRKPEMVQEEVHQVPWNGRELASIIMVFHYVDTETMYIKDKFLHYGDTKLFFLHSWKLKEKKKKKKKSKEGEG